MSQHDPVKTAARTLDVFEVFAQAKGPLTLTELAGRLGSPISSCHALVRTLQARGYVYILDDRKRVYPTKRLLKIAQQIAQNDPVLERIGPVLAMLQQDTGETIILGKRQGNTITYLDVVEGRQTIRYAADAGDIKPLHSSAIGKAMLGVLPAAELARFIKKLPLQAVTDNTIHDPAALLQDIETARTRGYYVTNGENVPEVMAISIARVIGEEPIGRLAPRVDALVAALLRAGEALQRIDTELHGQI
jgi:DNA-binding IclR family transcriptional regulator